MRCDRSLKNKRMFSREMSDQINTVNARIYTAVKSDMKLHLAHCAAAKTGTAAFNLKNLPMLSDSLIFVWLQSL